ncbi:peptide chain release factor N(5)-glutamine methyltransferase [Aquihabitans sp. G128]|uniref:peptide chain release factor N(5)-glutamine methyltransferase n=1 Tax=Aquihabitans sp. G128 TaxID=2849779 RepID=UPI001C2362BF|nr:peptide chain release factor N(5)-glutamine methyltransferase [Aquihabitans sp. G128]QXC63176.1 peptide chain release factor N(5)-glutamine methyltransferase [Aquihabitans sp. G128]
MSDEDALPEVDAERLEAERSAADLEGTVAWRALLAEAAASLAAAGVDAANQEARWIVGEATGLEGAELVLGLDELATVRGVARLDAMVARRTAGEPIQYVLGSWGFRSLDLLCDRRALIPRPETEQVVEVALRELDRALLARHGGHRPVAVDLGTGTGAIALSLAVERPGTEVWAVDRSADALAVARANLAGLGMAGTRVRLAEGSWFDPLPDDLRSGVDLVVTNPPYVAAHEELPAAVLDWEPVDALVPGPTGLEAYEVVLADAAAWLAPGGAFVAEVGHAQAAAVVELATAAGLVDAAVHQDHAGLDRAVVARRPG